MGKDGHNRGSGSAAFLLAQVGAQAAVAFAERLSPHQLTPANAGILRLVAQSPGLSQQELAKRLRMHASRLVAFVDELEKKELLQRKSSAEDRRVYALYLTEKGTETLKLIGQVAREHQRALCAPLSDEEQILLADLLLRIAQSQGLEANVHPGFGRATTDACEPPSAVQVQASRPDDVEVRRRRARRSADLRPRSSK
jgi:DNA-binding MarR family transcriptional regulator